LSSVRARSAAMKPEEMKRRATASPIPGPAPTMAITGLELGLWDIVFEILRKCGRLRRGGGLWLLRRVKG
jgi:hypothetical protein